MSLEVGTRLGPYEVVRQIGAGGMGEVYGATDPRLGRSVAIKVLPPELRAHADRLRRFEQEARTIGALNHPNLLTLHDVGEFDGAPYLVTELLDGQSLRQRLLDGPVSVRETTRIAREVARGLAAAHTAGVVHRDIKPDNLFITADARVKILDFGIAKLRDLDVGNAGGTRPGLGLMPTHAATEGTGMVIGTPGYMAPEQLAGKPVDPRTDIFSLGVVIYELVTGRRPFASETAVEESYAIMKSDPPSLPASVPPSLERIIMRCLEKRPAARFQSASDLAFALETLDGGGEINLGRASTPLPFGNAQTVAGVGLGSAATAIGPAPAPGGTPGDGVAPTVAAERDPTPARAKNPTPAASPVLAVPQIVVAAAPVARGAGRWRLVALVTTAIAAAAVVKLAWPSKSAASATWPDNVVGGPRFRRVTFRPRDQWFARFDPKSSSVLYSVRATYADDWHVYRSAIERPSVEPVDVVGRVLAISGAGELALSTPWPAGPGGILSRGFPGAGTPRKLGEGITDAAWAPDGETLAVTRHSDRGASIEYPLGTVIVHRGMGTLPYLAISPDGQRIAFCEIPGGHEAHGRVVIADLHGTELAESPPHPTIRGLAWSPDGREVWFSTLSTDPEDSAIHALSRDGHERVLLRTAGSVVLHDVAKDGRILVALGDARTRMMIGGRSDPKKDDYAWFDGSDVQSISADGKTIAFVEASGTGQTVEGHAAYVRTGNQEPVLVGHASRIAIVPGTPEVSAVIEMIGDTLHRVATEQGASTALPQGTLFKLDQTDRMALSWDGKFLVVRGEDASKTKRLWLWDLAAGSAPRPVGPANNTRGYHPISADGKWLALPRAAGGLELVSTGSEASRVLLAPDPAELDEPLSFTADGTALIAMAAHKYPRRVYRIELAASATAAPSPWQPWTDLDIASKPTLFEPVFSADAETVAYSYRTEDSDLYVIEPPVPPNH